MGDVVKSMGGFFAGAVAAVLSLIGVNVGLWATRTVWFERATRDDLQYFDLMMLLGLGTMAAFVPAVLGGGLLGGWLASRADAPPDVRDSSV